MHPAKDSQLHRLPIPSHEMIGVICSTFTTKKAQVRVILGVADWEIICFVVRVLFSVFSIFCITSFGDKTLKNSKSSPLLKLPQVSRNMRSHSGIRSSCDFAQSKLLSLGSLLPVPTERERERERQRQRQTVRRENLGTRLAQSLCDACLGLLGQCISVRHPRRTAGTLLDLATRKAQTARNNEAQNLGNVRSNEAPTSFPGFSPTRLMKPVVRRAYRCVGRRSQGTYKLIRHSFSFICTVIIPAQKRRMKNKVWPGNKKKLPPSVFVSNDKTIFFT